LVEKRPFTFVFETQFVGDNGLLFEFQNKLIIIKTTNYTFNYQPANRFPSLYLPLQKEIKNIFS